jgi:hypothetical protein
VGLKNPNQNLVFYSRGGSRTVVVFRLCVYERERERERERSENNERKPRKRKAFSFRGVRCEIGWGSGVNGGKTAHQCVLSVHYYSLTALPYCTIPIPSYYPKSLLPVCTILFALF